MVAALDEFARQILDDHAGFVPLRRTEFGPSIGAESLVDSIDSHQPDEHKGIHHHLVVVGARFLEEMRHKIVEGHVVIIDKRDALLASVVSHFADRLFFAAPGGLPDIGGPIRMVFDIGLDGL